ncbi:hypothetical protein HYV58_00075, partial [Candidatus Peregrinibacteria bacterium]|nr:hypothetical protein [Candidatus Peregrinibacteria bacterium]
TRKKHDASFPLRAIEFCLREAKITPADLSYAVFYEKPLLKFDRIIKTFLAYWPRGLIKFIKIIPLWLRERWWIRSIIKKNLPGFAGKVAFIPHHLSHAASSYFASPFQKAAVLTVDGVGEWTTAAWGSAEKNQIELEEEMRFPNSLGLLYSAFTAFLGFEVNDGEYKVMGLAPYGKPVYREALRKIAHLYDDGSLWLDMDYFSFPIGDVSFSKKFLGLFGEKREPESDFEARHFNIAATIQEFCEEAMVCMARYVWEKTHAKNLCLAGGVALNCAANSRIREKVPFKKIFIQPAAGDAGGALGAAKFLWHTLENHPKSNASEMPYYGPSYSHGEISEFLRKKKVQAQELQPSELVETASRLLAEGKVVGWFQGKMEWGPRALGARSILADPRPEKMRDIVNEKIKFRESFRPFAPVIPAEFLRDWFFIKDESPYMLFTCPVQFYAIGF